MTFVPFAHAHILSAAELVAAGVAGLRRRVPALPGTWADPAHVARALTGLVDRGAGLAALDDGDLVAFQAALMLDGRGGRWVHTSDVGHAAPPDPEGRLRARLYAQLAEGWIRSACAEHVVTVRADDEVALATYARLGFGRHVENLVGDLDPITAGPLADGVAIRPAEPVDARKVMDLEVGLRRHLEASPVFLRPGVPSPLEVHRRQLEDPAIGTFVAERDGDLVAFLRIGPCAADVATIVRDPGTASVTAVFTRPEMRGMEVASHLLAVALDWVHHGGYVRWAVAHESANGEASRFWARYAVPVTVSMSRRLAPGTMP